MEISPEKCIKEIRSLQKGKRYSEATEAASRALRRFPDDGDVNVAAATLYENIRQYSVAFGLITKVVRGLTESKRPVPPSVMLSFGHLALRNNKVAEAKRVFQKLEAAGLTTTGLFVGQAAVAIKENKLEEAEQLVKKALAREPETVNLRFVRAQLLLAQESSDEGLKVLEENFDRTEPHGESVDLWLGTLKKLNKERYAQDKLELLAAKYPTVLEFIYGFGALAHRAGEYNVARKALEQALSLSPNNNRILHELAILERLAGHIERSMEYVERSLAQNGDNPPALRTHAMEHKFAYGDAEFSRLLSTAANYANFKESDQIQLHFATAKAFDDVGDLKVAFRHYGVGGQKKLKTDPYKRREAEKVGMMLGKYITQAGLAGTKDRGTEDETAVFILGMPRSGTSLLEQILASHPDIYGAGELKYLGGVLENMIINNNAIHIGEKEPLFPREAMTGWAERGDRYIQQLRKLGGNKVQRIVDKMPGNYNYVGMIHAIMPNARIIHSQRHPLDTCLSCYRILFAEGQLWSYDLTDLAHHYRKYWNLMEHWRQEFPGRMYEVFYEQTVSDVEAQARSLISHIGLPWDDACLQFHQTDRVVKTASASQVRKPIYTTSAYRWKKYEKQLAPLIDEIGDIVELYESRLQKRIELGQFGT